jgi:hypothetical protein
MSDTAMANWQAAAAPVMAHPDPQFPDEVAEILWNSWRAHNHSAASTAIGRKKVKTVSKPWFDREVDELRTLSAKANWCARKADADSSLGPETKSKAREVVRTVRAAYQRTMRKKKMASQLELYRNLERSQKTGKLFWKLSNRLFKKKSGSRLPKSAINAQGEIVSNTTEVLNI